MPHVFAPIDWILERAYQAPGRYEFFFLPTLPLLALNLLSTYLLFDPRLTHNYALRRSLFAVHLVLGLALPFTVKARERDFVFMELGSRFAALAFAARGMEIALERETPVWVGVGASRRQKDGEKQEPSSPMRLSLDYVLNLQNVGWSTSVPLYVLPTPKIWSRLGLIRDVLVRMFVGHVIWDVLVGLWDVHPDLSTSAGGRTADLWADLDLFGGRVTVPGWIAGYLITLK